MSDNVVVASGVVQATGWAHLIRAAIAAVGAKVKQSVAFVAESPAHLGGKTAIYCSVIFEDVIGAKGAV
jgi:pyrimidine deaminase RibD-like protein